MAWGLMAVCDESILTFFLGSWQQRKEGLASFDAAGSSNPDSHAGSTKAHTHTDNILI